MYVACTAGLFVLGSPNQPEGIRFMEQREIRRRKREDLLASIFPQLSEAYAYGILLAWVAGERYDLLTAIGIDNPEEELGAPDPDKVDESFRAMFRGIEFPVEAE